MNPVKATTRNSVATETLAVAKYENFGIRIKLDVTLKIAHKDRTIKSFFWRFAEIRMFVKRCPKNMRAEAMIIIFKTMADSENSGPAMRFIIPSAKKRVPMTNGIIRIKKTLKFLLTIFLNFSLLLKML
jgi:hypothetical protein